MWLGDKVYAPIKIYVYLQEFCHRAIYGRDVGILNRPMSNRRSSPALPNTWSETESHKLPDEETCTERDFQWDCPHREYDDR